MAKGKDPAFLFFSADFMVDTADMTDVEVGKYMRLIAYQHQKDGKIPEDYFMRISENLPKVLAMFSEKDGFYFNKDLKLKMKQRKEKCAINARNADIRWKNYKNKSDANAYTNAYTNAMQTHMPKSCIALENTNTYVLSKDVLSEKDVLSDQINDNAVCETKKNEVENFGVEKTAKKTEASENAIKGDLKKDPDWMVAEKAAKAIAESKAHSDAVEAYINSTPEEREERKLKAFIERTKNPPPKAQTLEEIRDRTRFLKEENRKYLESLINEAFDPEYLNAMRKQFKWKCDVDQEFSDFRTKVTVTAPDYYAGRNGTSLRLAFQDHLSKCKDTKKFNKGNQNQSTALVARLPPTYTGR